MDSHLAGQRTISTVFALRPQFSAILQETFRKITTAMRAAKLSSQTSGVKILTRLRMGDALAGYMVNQLKGL